MGVSAVELVGDAGVLVKDRSTILAAFERNVTEAGKRWHRLAQLVSGETGEYDRPITMGVVLDDVREFYPIQQVDRRGICTGKTEIRAHSMAFSAIEPTATPTSRECSTGREVFVSLTDSWEDAYIASEILNTLKNRRQSEDEAVFDTIVSNIRAEAIR